MSAQVDCTLAYELEEEEHAWNGTLTPDLYLMKLVVGAVKRSSGEQVLDTACFVV